MPSVSVKLYSVVFKALLKHKLSSHSPSADGKDGSGLGTLRLSNKVPANASFVDGVATKDLNIDASLTLRIFLPESVLPQELITPGNTGLFGCIQKEAQGGDNRPDKDRRSSCGGDKRLQYAESRRNSWGGERVKQLLSKKECARLDICQSFHGEGNQLIEEVDDKLFAKSQCAGSFRVAHDTNACRGNYRGYLPDIAADNNKRLPIIVQFHGGGFVAGSKDSTGNDYFCRRMAKICDAIVVAVGYRLAPEHKYPAAFDDGFNALAWIAKQANLAECNKSVGISLQGKISDEVFLPKKSDRELISAFGGSSIAEPWISAHGDPSRCVLLGVSSGGNIADFVARKAVQAGRLLDPIKIVAQVLMYPFFIGSLPTQSEVKLANSYFYDRATCILAWKLLFPEGKFSLDHPVANPLVPGREPPLKHMPPTLTVVGELDWMKDRAIAYSEALRRASLDAPVLEYKDAVHEFATLDFLVKSRQAEACAEDVTIWIKKYVSQKGHEFSY
ncbi:hypothetical protein KP509_32G072500 [Ceratopteris richardii]|uniref:Alpha/beta hydrolase fold-3 domain-containing protein n=1 Tax=Ceratopteris richardii TaxID=49495 RepID=A0A8T2QWE6_CERRI|nr:hypothetical protein KP509_32G072500 [Ceratopteris richardii]KAH7287756.1 hypothetical protein KP509_32G072500 [Ceratopteris richardii]